MSLNAAGCEAAERHRNTIPHRCDDFCRIGRGADLRTSRHGNAPAPALRLVGSDHLAVGACSSRGTLAASAARAAGTSATDSVADLHDACEATSIGPCATHHDDCGRIIGTTTSDSLEQRWTGRPGRECRFAIGDIVGVLSERVTVGVVLARPPSPTDPLARRGHLDVSDDVYLVGFPDRDGDDHRLDHDHPHESDLVRVTTPLADPLLARLERRLRDYARGDDDAARALRLGGPKLAARFGSSTIATNIDDLTSSHTEER